MCCNTKINNKYQTRPSELGESALRLAQGKAIFTFFIIAPVQLNLPSPNIHVTIVYNYNLKTMRAASSISAMKASCVYWNNPN